MRAELVPMLRCPASGEPLALEGDRASWVDKGVLVARRAGTRYRIDRGMAYLYVDDQDWVPKAREARGWVRLHQDKKIYDQTGLDIDFQLPYFPQDPWITVARQFDIALAILDPRPGEWILDVGAGRGWAAKHFAVRGCHAVAIDVVDDEQIGLGRSRALMEQAGVTYDIMIGDHERLPFADGVFDVVFCAATLHHTTNLAELMRNLGRVLRPGGRMIAINEPCIADSADDEELRRTVLAEELSYGINETRPRLGDYRRVLREAELREEAIFDWHTYGATLRAMTTWSRQLGIRPPWRFFSRDLWRRLTRPLPPARCFGTALPQAWHDHLLRERSGETILVATKSPK